VLTELIGFDDRVFVLLMVLMIPILFYVYRLTRSRIGGFRDNKADLAVLFSVIIDEDISLYKNAASIAWSFILLLFLVPLNATCKYIINKFIGDDRLRSILVWWGIIFFIVSNLLQFISTF